MSKPKVIVVLGPTASGKSDCAVTIAERFSGEVISADSRQVYRGLDIGTAKITKDEMRGVTHHLIDVVDIETTYTAADFKHDAKRALEAIISRKNVPVIAGGSFFYVDVLLGKTTLAEVPPNPDLRTELEKRECKDLFAALEKLDPHRAATIDPENKHRLIRALEIVSVLGAVPPPTSTDIPYDVLTIGLSVDKETLRSRFASRATSWLHEGFKDEVEGLLTAGVERDRLQEIGFEYTLMLEYIDGTITEDNFIQKFIEKNWQYAKRQMTWLKRDNTIKWFDLDDDSMLSLVADFLAN